MDQLNPYVAQLTLCDGNNLPQTWGKLCQSMPFVFGSKLPTYVEVLY